MRRSFCCATVVSPADTDVLYTDVAVPTDVVDGQLRRLLHDVLACAPPKGGLGVLPKLPLWNGRGALHACSVELYILRQCAAIPLPASVGMGALL